MHYVNWVADTWCVIREKRVIMYLVHDVDDSGMCQPFPGMNPTVYENMFCTRTGCIVDLQRIELSVKN